MANVLPPLTEEGVFTIVFKLRPVPFTTICEEVLRISSVGDGPLLPGSTTVHVQPKWRRVQGFLRKLKNNSLIEHESGKRNAAWQPTEAVTDTSLLCDIMSMVLEQVPTEQTIDLSWSPWDRAQAVLWSWNSAYLASDNTHIRQIPLPQVLKAYHV